MQHSPASASNNHIVAAADELSFRPAGSPAISVRRRILFVTTELEGLVSVGGLGAVSAALPRILCHQHDVRVLLPAYPSVLARRDQIQLVGDCKALAGIPACRIGRINAPDGLVVYVIICPELFEREGDPYGDEKHRDWHDNDVRFARLGLCAAELAAGTVDREWRADLVHVNDWPSAMAPCYLAWKGIRIPTILTVHNLAYQGLFPHDSMSRIGAPETAFTINGIEFFGKVSFLKAGITYASHITTVSETYAREITEPQFGCGLDGLLRARASQGRLTGILNGIDESWDPRYCSHLTARFGPGDWKARRANADFVRRDFGLALTRGPLFGLVSRLVHQKGVDLVASVAEAIVAAGGQIVITGTGEEQLETALRTIAARFPRSIGVKIGFDEGRARRMYAGSDFLMMPSRYEPCGLSQMYAQRYGSLPIGHKTGGLADTIEDGKTGLLFGEVSVAGFLGAICRAFSIFGSKREFLRMQLTAMERQFSWRQPAMNYDALYKNLIGSPVRMAPRPA